MKVHEKASAPIAGDSMKARNIEVGQCFYILGQSGVHIRISNAIGDSSIRGVALATGKVIRLSPEHPLRTADATVIVEGISTDPDMLYDGGIIQEEMYEPGDAG